MHLALWLHSLIGAGPHYGGQPIPAPSSADSLAGVLARLFPDKVDSAQVGKVHWYQSPYDGLRLVPASDYAYRHDGARGQTKVVGEADPRDASITFATQRFTNAPAHSWGTDPELVKHELAHLMVKGAAFSHPARVFQKLESYRGR